jgi:hypothetical protein
MQITGECYRLNDKRKAGDAGDADYDCHLSRQVTNGQVGRIYFDESPAKWVFNRL